MRILRISFIVLLLSFLFNTASALWWGEYSVIFVNKKTGEFKSTYQMLYRFDNEEFRDSLAEYAIKDGVPNDKLFKDWSVAYFKHCDRDVCKTKWDSVKYSWLKAWEFPEMEPSDLATDEVAKFLPVPLRIKFLAGLFVLGLFGLVYSFSLKFPANRIARWMRIGINFVLISLFAIFLTWIFIVILLSQLII